MIIKFKCIAVVCLLLSLRCIQAQSIFDNYQKRADSFKKIYLGGASVSNKSVLSSVKLLRDSIVKEGHYALGGSISLTLGKLYQQLGMMTSAEKTYKEAISFGQKVNDSLWLAVAWERLGDFYSLENRNSLSLEAHLKALNINEKYDVSRTSIPDNYTSIAKAYIQSSDITTAESYLQKAIDLKKDLNDTLRMGVITTLHADILRLKKQYEKAVTLYKKDIPKRQKQKNYEGLFISYLGLGDAYYDWNKYQLAETAYQKALAVADTIQRYRSMGLALLKLGNIYQKTDQTKKAKEAYRRAVELCKQVDSRVYLMNAYESIYILNKNEGNLASALDNLEKYTEIYRLNADETQQIRTDDLRASFQLKEKEREIKNLDIEHKKTKQLQVILWAGIILLLLLSVFLIILYRSRNAAYKILHNDQEQIKLLLSEKESLLLELQNTHNQLVLSEKMASLGVMMAGIAHEINNPVSSIHACAEALLMDFQEIEPIFQKLIYLTETKSSPDNLERLTQIIAKSNLKYLSTEMTELLNTIMHGSERTANLISGLKTFTINTGDKFLPYKVEDGLDATLVLLNHKIKNTIKIEKQYYCNQDVLCQISKINQVFVNILDNAIQILGDRGRIVIRTEKIENLCVITILDDGPGMEESVSQKIFEPFFTTKEIGNGTGLGLSISYTIVKEHNGDIKVISKPGEGTVFTISIPLA